jgi:pilus assembly protein TadC
MFRQRTEHSLLGTLFIYLLGVLAGVQIALYLFDYFDDGVAEPLSGWIGVGFLAVGLAVAMWPFVRARRARVA